MNVQLENLPNCIATLRVEVPSDKVSKARETILQEYAKYAKLPGFRAGKAPKAVIAAKFKNEIQEELQKRVLSDSCREAIVEKNLKVLNISKVEDVKFGDDSTLSYTATVVTVPEFELPEYKGIKVQVKAAEVTDKDVDEGIERLREQAANFSDVTDRDLIMGDFAVVTYAGTIDGKSIGEVLPVAKMLAENKDFWIKLTPDTFLPGFSDKLVGQKIGETREFDLTVPADFVVKELAGKTLHYTVTLNSIKAQTLPELNDEFAATVAPGKKLAELRDIIKSELARQKSSEQETEKRNLIMSELLSKVECELPESMVANEARRVMDDIIRENQSRGVPDSVIAEKHAELETNAKTNARNRLKGTFVLLRIAQTEKLTVTQQEVDQRVALMAMRYNMPADKLRKELEKREALDSVNEEILTGKTLDFLVANASVETVAPVAA